MTDKVRLGFSSIRHFLTKVRDNFFHNESVDVVSSGVGGGQLTICTPLSGAANQSVRSCRRRDQKASQCQELTYDLGRSSVVTARVWRTGCVHYDLLKREILSTPTAMYMPPIQWGLRGFLVFGKKSKSLIPPYTPVLACLGVQTQMRVGDRSVCRYTSAKYSLDSYALAWRLYIKYKHNKENADDAFFLFVHTLVLHVTGECVLAGWMR
ncbi:hypothetical protein BX666DRAFT_274635 [Dichotomocladium elegans]|nr:hypothetical protein BX666DRAFT_274635 [Dichotomocladium elegans]